MPQDSCAIVKQFAQQCIWAHQSWQTRKCLFDDDTNLSTFRQPHYEHLFLRLSIILQEYWMQQVAKLHDPAGKPGQQNLSVDYVIERGEWDAITKARLSGLRDEMLPFVSKMKVPRNKVTAHNDVDTILAAAELGKFNSGEDADYFECLRAFAEIVVSTVLGQHFDYDNAVTADVELFVAAFDRGRIR